MLVCCSCKYRRVVGAEFDGTNVLVALNKDELRRQIDRTLVRVVHTLDLGRVDPTAQIQTADVDEIRVVDLGVVLSSLLVPAELLICTSEREKRSRDTRNALLVDGHSHEVPTGLVGDEPQNVTSSCMLQEVLVVRGLGVGAPDVVLGRVPEIRAVADANQPVLDHLLGMGKEGKLGRKENRIQKLGRFEQRC